MSLEELRRRIDGIDVEIVRLLNERAQKAVEIGDEKERDGVPVRDPEREHEVVSRVAGLNAGPLSDQDLAGIYQRIIAACTGVQRGKES